MADSPEFVYNHDVRGMHSRINRFIIEAMKAGSNRVSQVSQFDVDRMRTYLDAIMAYKAWVIAQPQLDIPESDPTEWMLDKDPEVPVMENESIRDLCVLLELTRNELVNSQSARMPSGMMNHDARRFDSYIMKARNFLDNYVAPQTPLDLPESSPMREPGEDGNLGV